MAFDEKWKSLVREKEEWRDYLSDDEDLTLEEASKDLEDFQVNFDTCVVVDNLPKVNSAKHEKLLNVVKKVLGKIGKIELLDMPYDAEGKMTLGVVFVAMESKEVAVNVVNSIDGFQLDKAHRLKLNLYSDMEKYQNTPQEYKEVEVEAFKEKANLKEWLLDGKGRDMYALRYSQETEIHWCEGGVPSLQYDGEKEKQDGKTWCSQYVKWSPMGTYLTTFHPRGIALWGGDGFEKCGKFEHRGVKITVFSPMENYLITSNGVEGEDSIIVWDVRRGKMLRSFATKGQIMPFRWSFDDKYVAQRGDGVIRIYELPSMKLLEKKSLRADGVNCFYWSPSDNCLAYWAPETPNAPARVSLVDIPSRREIRRKNLFNVSDCKIHWQASGDFLCVKVTRHSKSKKTLYTNFELFRIRESLVPVEMLEMKDNIVAFAWEPKGTRFAIVHGEGNLRLSVSFYDMCTGAKNDELALLYTLEDKACNRLYWSPQGNYIVMAGLEDMNGTLEFWSTDDQQSLAIQEHFKCTNVEWDPSGRVVSSAVCQPLDNSYFKYQMDNGYSLWSFQGKNLLEQRKDEFYQFLWRPRPKSLLSDKEYKNVIKNLKKYERKFHELDRKKEKDRNYQVKNKKNLEYTKFTELLAIRNKEYREKRAQLIKLRDGYDSEDDDLYVVTTETIERVLSENRSIVD